MTTGSHHPLMWWTRTVAINHHRTLVIPLNLINGTIDYGGPDSAPADVPGNVC